MFRAFLMPYPQLVHLKWMWSIEKVWNGLEIYTAKFDGDTVRPNPPHTRFSFTLNSAARRKS